jgi:hypothetical protein
VGGGGQVTTTGGGNTRASLVASRPDDAANPRGWFVEAVVEGNTGQQTSFLLTGFAICAVQ